MATWWFTDYPEYVRTNHHNSTCDTTVASSNSMVSLWGKWNSEYTAVNNVIRNWLRRVIFHCCAAKSFFYQYFTTQYMLFTKSQTQRRTSFDLCTFLKAWQCTWFALRELIWLNLLIKTSGIIQIYYTDIYYTVVGSCFLIKDFLFWFSKIISIGFGVSNLWLVSLLLEVYMGKYVFLHSCLRINNYLTMYKILIKNYVLKMTVFVLSDFSDFECSLQKQFK